MKKINNPKSLKDNDIDYSDIPKTNKEFWADAKLVLPKENKKSIALRIDNDVLKWLKSQGKGYQSKINNILRSYMNHHL